MGLLGKILVASIDVATSPIAVLKDITPGAGGYIDGNRSHTERKAEKTSKALKEIKEEIREL
jgi:hypothetical protein